MNNSVYQIVHYLNNRTNVYDTEEIIFVIAGMVSFRNIDTGAQMWVSGSFFIKEMK